MSDTTDSLVAELLRLHLAQIAASKPKPGEAKPVVIGFCVGLLMLAQALKNCPLPMLNLNDLCESAERLLIKTQNEIL